MKNWIKKVVASQEIDLKPEDKEELVREVTDHVLETVGDGIAAIVENTINVAFDFLLEEEDEEDEGPTVLEMGGKR